MLFLGVFYYLCFSISPARTLGFHGQLGVARFSPQLLKRKCSGGFFETSRTGLFAVKSTEGTVDHEILWSLATNHCVSQALYTFLELNLHVELATVSIDTDQKGRSVAELTGVIGPTANSEALWRTLRLLTTVNILKEIAGVPSTRSSLLWWEQSRYALTETGFLLVEEQSLRDDNSMQEKGWGDSGMASCIKHWMEAPLWSSWLDLPNYIRGEGERISPSSLTGGGNSLTPFALANDGISSDFYYNTKDHPRSLEIANNFVQWIHRQEVTAVVQGYDWSTAAKEGLRVLDVGGHYGTVLKAVVDRHPGIKGTSFDLPGVVAQAPTSDQVELIGGDVFDSSTIPDADIILLKHFLDRCMWDEDETIQILRNCKGALIRDRVEGSSQGYTEGRYPRRLIIAEAVLPDPEQVSNKTTGTSQNLSLHMDTLYMLVGRERQRTYSEWASLAEQADFKIVSLQPTSVPSCSLLVLEPV